MFLFNKTLQFSLCSLIASLSLTSALEAYPYAYRRLVLKKGGKIEKVVELISDLPIPEVAMAKPGNFDLQETLKTMLGDIVKKPEIFDSIPAADRNEFVVKRIADFIKMGSSEKGLIAALRAIGANEHVKVQLFGEGSIQFAQAGEFYGHESNTMISHYVPYVLSQEFTRAQNKGLIYVEHMPQLRNDPSQANETLKKIIASEHEHIIVFGEGNYCQQLNDLLIKEGKFKLKKSAGTEHDGKLKSMKLKWKILRHAPLIALFRGYRAYQRIGKKLETVSKKHREKKLNNMFESIMKKKIDPAAAKIKVDADAEIIFNAVEKAIRGALGLHRDVVAMIPPLSAKTWKHLGV